MRDPEPSSDESFEPEPEKDIDPDQDGDIEKTGGQPDSGGDAATGDPPP